MNNEFKDGLDELRKNGWSYPLYGSGSGTGPQGPKGDTGPQGPKGIDGKTPHIGENGNWWIGTVDTGVKARGEISKEEMETLMNTYFAENLDKLAGKKIVCFGDSLMVSKDAIERNDYDSTYGWQGGYPKKIKEAHSNASVYNFSIPNGALCTNTVNALAAIGQNTANIFEVVKENIHLIKNADYVLLNGCGNDIYVAGMQGKNLVTDIFGTPSASIPTTVTDDNTICGALEIMFEWLTTNYPQTKIIYLSLPPIKQFYSVPTMYNEEIENKLIEYSETICKKYGVTFVNLCNTILRRDLFLDSGFFYASDVHLTNKGYDAVANLINSVL